MSVTMLDRAETVWSAAWADYRRREMTWRAGGMAGARPRLVLPIDRPRPVWAGHADAYDAYRATVNRVEAHLDALDPFDVPSLRRPDIRAADRAIQAAFARHDLAAVRAALAVWEAAICGGAR